MKNHLLHTTNTIKLTEIQEDNVGNVAREIFEKRFTDDFTHFSFEGTNLNFKNMSNCICVFEVHSEIGSFCLTIELNENKKALKKTFKAETL